jgi:diguanylate cyclase (GGDEF)-like protein
MTRLDKRRAIGSLKRLQKKAGHLYASFEPAPFLSYAPLVVLLLSFYTLALIMGAEFPPFVYLFLGLVLMASGILGLRSGSAAVLATILAGQAALWLAGNVTWGTALASAAGLILSAVGIPWMTRARILSLAASHDRLMREQMEARLNLGERLAHGATPNSVAVATQPTSGTESLVRNLLLCAKKALKARTTVFYWYNAEQDLLVPVETLSDTPEALLNRSISLAQGRLVGLKTVREPLTLRYNPNTTHQLPIYRKKMELSGLIAIPVHHRGTLAGALLADRAGAEPFYLPDSVIAKRIGEMVEDSLATERRLKAAVMLTQQLKMMDEAARQFSTARAFEQVYDAVVRYAVGFAPFNTAILAHRVNTAGEEFEIVGVNSKQLARLIGSKFKLKGSLCDLAAKSRTHLPASFEFDKRMAQPFGPEVGLEMEDGESCLLLPLMTREDAVGFLLMADRRKQVEKDDLVSLFLFAEYCAVSLVNAEANKELERMAVTDPLTALANHRAFRTRIVEACQRSDRSKKPVSLLFLDIDHFKAVNDSFGHSAGDVVLKAVARCLGESIRKVDFAARYGGEEFVAVLEETGASGALVMAERLRQRISKMTFEELGGKGVTASIGIACYPDDTTGIEELVVLADAALYRAKNEGRNQCQVA